MRNDGANPIACHVIYPLLFGSHHVVFPLEFSDGLWWALKVPVTGYRGLFGRSAAEALTCEALVMRLVRRETSVPVPRVHLVDASIHKELNCPFSS